MPRTASPAAFPRLAALFSIGLLAVACGDSDTGAADTERVRSDVAVDVANDVVEADVARDATADVGEDVAPDGDTSDASGSGDASVDAEPDVVAVEPEVIVVPGAEALPEAFGAAEAGAQSGPQVLYPTDNTLMPNNVFPPVIQWDGPANGRYRVTAETDSRVHYVYTTDWSWQPDPDVWSRWISETRDGALRISVARVTASGELAEGAAVRVKFSSSSIGGAVYFWSPSAGGIVRLPVDEPAPEPFLTPGTLPCVGCHGLSPDGSRLAYTLATNLPTAGTLGVMGTDDARTEYISPSAGFPIFYPSFGPDNVHLAGARGDDVVILNTDTAVVTDTLQRPEGTAATYPAWSPRDDTIVFSAGTAGMSALTGGTSSAGLARVRRGADGEWGAASWLVENGEAGGAPENLFYPSFSPDSRWVVFNRATSDVAVGGAPVGSSVWMVPAYGGDAVRMDWANGPMGTTNSWPKWAPTSADGTLWVAFTSDRLYGRLGGGSTDTGQIWIAGLTPGGTAEGEDPSFSAYWMPGQEVTESNHVAYWTEYVKE